MTELIWSPRASSVKLGKTDIEWPGEHYLRNVAKGLVKVKMIVIWGTHFIQRIQMILSDGHASPIFSAVTGEPGEHKVFTFDDSKVLYIKTRSPEYSGAVSDLKVFQQSQGLFHWEGQSSANYSYKNGEVAILNKKKVDHILKANEYIVGLHCNCTNANYVSNLGFMIGRYE